MQQKAELNRTGKRMRLAACALLACLVWWSPVGHSLAQQQQDRKLALGDGSRANAGKRIALVIGNGAYTNAPMLKNPPNDARDMAAALSKLGFEVEHGVNVQQRQMKSMIRQFGQKLKAGGQGVFYYAGHGVQSKGRNYLLPVDAVIESEADVEDAGVDLQLMLNYMDDAQNGLNIVILDACRNNPFARSMRSAENGLAQVDAPTGTLIAYATAPGKVASDGTGQNGLYTTELLKQMSVPGLSVTEMFMRVRADVVKQTSGKQVPWEASSLIGSFSFNAATNRASDTTSKPSTTLADATTVEAEYWETIKNSTDVADYQEYLKEYPQGRYGQLARLKLRQLEAARNSRNNNVEMSKTTEAEQSPPRAGMDYNGWSRFAPEEGRFSVWMPGTPTPNVTTTDSQFGPYTVHLFMFTSPKAIYLAGWVDYAPTFKFGVQAEINANRDNFLKGINARLLTEKKITLDGNPGIEVTAESNDVKFITTRIYIVGSRPYQLITMTNLQEEKGNVDKFLASFKIVAGK